MSITLMIVSRPSSAPPTAATTRRGRAGRSSSTATAASPSTGMRRNAAGVSWSISRGAVSAQYTSTPANTVVTRRSTTRLRLWVASGT